MTPQPTAALHLGSGEPVLLLQPFMLSPHVWRGVAERLAESYEVFAPAFAGHWGGPRLNGWDASASAIADAVEKQLDELGWNTCHIVGNSLGGWVGFELERRGRARTLTAVAPAGGWRHLSPDAILVGLKFLSLGPLVGIGKLVGGFVARNRLVHRAFLPLVSKDAKAVEPQDAEAMILAASNCRAFLPVLWSGLKGGGVTGLADVKVPTRLLLCEYGRIIPMRRYGSMFIDELPAVADRVTMEGVGHCPQLEAPEKVAALISEHVASYRPHLRAV
ncbi:alpha/beta fold hydrolase [Antrihabitans sp. NCIMB 15449]|uniref:Alpha/beta fold hydrolase n=1 Tax=Antrihabitans spumae TaxID=3373370 RepID=A0ABW7JLQ3_9NOCA